MADNTNKVTIDAAWFIELHQTAEKYELAKAAIANSVKERDELKAKLDAECADKLKVINELNETRELNRKCCDKNDDLKAKLEEKIKRLAKVCAHDINGTCPLIPTNERLAEAERCIEDIAEVMSDGVIADCAEGTMVNNIIRAYREKKEAR